VQRSRPGQRLQEPLSHWTPARHDCKVSLGPFSDETLIMEAPMDIRDMTTRILAILEEDDEEEDPEEDA
jgi:hypothetical protein